MSNDSAPHDTAAPHDTVAIAQEIWHDTVIRDRELTPEPGDASSVELQDSAEQGLLSPRYALRIGTHSPIVLDTPVYVGRHPSLPRIPIEPLPRLVSVPSPTREISTTHVELRQEGSIVVVTDLGSTNGTTITGVGEKSIMLRRGESFVAGAGSRVEIGDGVTISILPISVSAGCGE